MRYLDHKGRLLFRYFGNWMFNKEKQQNSKYSFQFISIFQREPRILVEATRSFYTEKSRNKAESENESGEEHTKLTQDLLKNNAEFEENVLNNPENSWSTFTYPVPVSLVQTEKNDEKPSKRIKVNARDRTIIMFPGQGSQKVGMGKDLMHHPNILELYNKASEIVRYDLKKLCIEGPQSELDQTQFCQVALLVTSLAALEKLRFQSPEAIENCVATMGFSVGEFAALVFAGAITFEEAVHLVHVRGEAMQAASDLVPSGMITIFQSAGARLPLAMEGGRDWALKCGVQKPVCEIANYLFPQTKVIAGHNQALEFIEKNAHEFGIRRVRRIAVSGAFHTALMEPALEVWEAALKQVHFVEPLIPVYSNVTAKPHILKKIQKNLSLHIVRPVHWEQTLERVYARPKGDEFPKTYECGPGESLKAILKSKNRTCWESAISISV